MPGCHTCFLQDMASNIKHFSVTHRLSELPDYQVSDCQTCCLQDMVGNIKYFSITHRLFKLPGLLEADSEDYGQRATYKVSATCAMSHTMYEVSHGLYKRSQGIPVYMRLQCRPTDCA